MMSRFFFVENQGWWCVGQSTTTMLEEPILHHIGITEGEINDEEYKGLQILVANT